MANKRAKSAEVDPMSRRERQIMDVLLREKQATAREVWEQIPDAPSYSTVRKLLSVLEEKGHVKHTESGATYVYTSARPRSEMATSALRRMRDTFFEGSVEQVVSGLLSMKDTEIASDELNRIAKMIAEAKKKGAK
ncbi:MAG: BlaI/MecI/CopY family transcriptional regulator [Verrucomicrobiae bacterium]|nr:BlaI/MecI/CopY family transcriptional regulator [Verrucomicrobiae bacterium]